MEMMVFPVDNADDKWHSLSLGISPTLVVMYFDCYLKFSGIFPVPAVLRFSADSSVHIGSCDKDDDMAFQVNITFS